MPVSSTSRKAGPFLGNGVSTSFPFAFKVFSASDVAVYHTDADDVQTLLATGYTVAINADQETSPGGSVTYPSAGTPMAADESLDVIGAQAYLQGADIRNGGTFQPSVIQRALDYLAILCQQLLERANRALSLPPGDTTSTTLPTATARAERLLAFDGVGAVKASDFTEAQVSNVVSAASELAFPSIGNYPGLRSIGLTAALALDCGPYVQAAVDSFAGRAGVVVFDPAYTYTQRTTVFVPYNVSIDFNSALIVPAGGALTNDYLYFTNMNAAQAQTVPLDTAVISEHPFIYGFRADATSSGYTTARGFLTKSRHQFEHFWCRDMAQAVKKIGNSNDQYMDRLRYRDFEVQTPQGVDWMLDVNYYGDALDIDGYHHAATAGANQNGIHVRNCNGGGIRNLINGSVWAEQCSAFSVDHVHNEYGSIRLTSTSATLRDVFQWFRPDLGQVNPLTIDVTTGGGRYPFSVSLQNYRFVLQHALATPFAANYVDADHFDILSSSGVSLNMDNVKRFLFVNLDPSLGYESAPRITFDGATTVAQWDTNQSAHCKSSNVSAGGKVVTPFNSFSLPGAAIADFGIAASAHGTWTEATGTYFYIFQQLWGPKDRLVGKNSVAERSVNVASAATIPRCQFDRSSTTCGELTLRIYRGTVSGNYDKVVDLPVGSAPMFYDMGHYLGTGERWRARAAGPVSTINTGFTKVDVNGSQVVVHGTAAPTVGTWATGDRVVVDDAGPGERPGWDCTGGGTPGTWDPLAKKPMVFSAVAFNPPNILAGAETTTTVAAAGVIASDFALASFDLNPAGELEITATCMTDAVMVKLRNVTAAPVDLPAGTLRVRVSKF